MAKIARMVSIHAPREGCDRFVLRAHSPVARFNSRTPGGVRHESLDGVFIVLHSFNSRTPGGVRHFPRSQMARLKSFNSRTPGGVRRRR